MKTLPKVEGQVGERRQALRAMLLTSWRDRQLICVSVQAPNGQSDLDRLDAALRTPLPQLQRR